MDGVRGEGQRSSSISARGRGSPASGALKTSDVIVRPGSLAAPADQWPTSVKLVGVQRRRSPSRTSRTAASTCDSPGFDLAARQHEPRCLACARAAVPARRSRRSPTPRRGSRTYGRPARQDVPPARPCSDAALRRLRARHGSLRRTREHRERSGALRCTGYVTPESRGSRHVDERAARVSHRCPRCNASDGD